MYALVTGASSGIGREIARLLAEKKYDLILVARRADRLEDLKKELTEKYAIDVVNKTYDLSVQENCYRLHQETLEYPIEIVINNAGFGKVGPFESVSLDSEIQMLELNMVGLHILMKLFSSSMTTGMILNVGSMAAFLPTPLLSTYAATKSYVVSVSQAVNYELKKQKRNVSVSVLCPGPVKTEFGKVADADNLGLPGISPEYCAKVAVKGMFKKKAVIIPSAQMKVMRFVLRFIPTKWILAMSYRIQTKKKNS